jgi:hypothetical protein
MAEKASIKITLTPEQQQEIQQAIGKQVSTLVLKLEPLEERFTPRIALN